MVLKRCVFLCILLFFISEGEGWSVPHGVNEVGGGGPGVSGGVPFGASTWDILSLDGSRGTVWVVCGGERVAAFRPIVRLSNGRFFGWSWVYDGPEAKEGFSAGVSEVHALVWVLSSEAATLEQDI